MLNLKEKIDYFELNGNKEGLNNFLFLDKKIMNEHQDGVDDIIHEYSV